MKKRYSRFDVSVPQMIVMGFAGLILVGALLLMLPISSQSGEWTPFIDALFTTTSATCVTGLTTLNTAEHWTFFGQVIIIGLIEIGGLGFMSIPILFYFISRKKISLSTRLVLRDSLNMESSGEVSLMRYIFKTAFLIQFLGALCFAIDFVPRYGWAKGLWFSLFHAISSFCNAGFDLFGDSMVGFQNNPWVLSIVMGLIIAGGLGFLVWYDLMGLRKKQRMTLHSKIALMMTGSLLLFGTLGFVVTEHFGNSLVASDNVVNRFFNTLFMAVTPRTAGYYSIDYFQMTHAGLILTIVLMFIGGTSGSTAGGLKTTTFGVLLLKVRSIFKGQKHAVFGERTIRDEAVNRALTLFFITLSLCILATMILSVTETIPDVDQLGLEYIAFEVISAFGTVGLTMGLTPDLTLVGKVIIILMMFIGRVGIMTVVFSMLGRSRQDTNFKYPEETVMIG